MGGFIKAGAAASEALIAAAKTAAKTAEADSAAVAKAADALQDLGAQATTVATDAATVAKAKAAQTEAQVADKVKAALDGKVPAQDMTAAGKAMTDLKTVAQNGGKVVLDVAKAEGTLAVNAAAEALVHELPKIEATAKVVGQDAAILGHDASVQAQSLAKEGIAEAKAFGNEKLKTELLQRLIRHEPLTQFEKDAAKMAGLDLEALQKEAQAAIDLSYKQYKHIGRQAFEKGDTGAAKKYFTDTFAAVPSAHAALDVLDEFSGQMVRLYGKRNIPYESGAITIYKTGLSRGADLVKTPEEIARLSRHLDSAKLLPENSTNKRLTRFIGTGMALGSFAKDALDRLSLKRLGDRMFANAAKNAETAEHATEIGNIASAHGYYDHAAAAYERAKVLPSLPKRAEVAEPAVHLTESRTTLKFVKDNYVKMDQKSVDEGLKKAIDQATTKAELEEIRQFVQDKSIGYEYGCYVSSKLSLVDR